VYDSRLGVYVRRAPSKAAAEELAAKAEAQHQATLKAQAEALRSVYGR
jgi:hypothetical protein